MNCGNELPSSYTVNYCPNCGHAVKKENRIAKYTSDGRPVNHSQENTSTKITDLTSIGSNIGAPEESARRLNTSDTTTSKIDNTAKHTIKPSSSGKGKAIGALIVIVIIIVIIALFTNWLYQSGIQTDKLLELGCTPEAWSQYGRVTIWSCPAWRGIDVNDPSTFMNQEP